MLQWSPTSSSLPLRQKFPIFVASVKRLEIQGRLWKVLCGRKHCTNRSHMQRTVAAGKKDPASQCCWNSPRNINKLYVSFLVLFGQLKNIRITDIQMLSCPNFSLSNLQCANINISHKLCDARSFSQLFQTSGLQFSIHQLFGTNTTNRKLGAKQWCLKSSNLSNFKMFWEKNKLQGDFPKFDGFSFFCRNKLSVMWLSLALSGSPGHKAWKSHYHCEDQTKCSSATKDHCRSDGCMLWPCEQWA